MLNGAGGTLTACFLASELIGVRKFARALLLASEVEPSRPVQTSNIVGLAQTASALVLEEATDDEGFAAFAFRAFPELVDSLVSHIGAQENRPAVFHHRDPDLDDKVVECVCQTIREWSTHEPLPLGEAWLVVAPQRPGGLELRIAEALGIERTRAVSLDAQKDYYTSSLAYALQKLRREGGLKPGTPIVFIEVAAGLQVWCALYYCG